MIKINGKEYSELEGKNISDMLSSLGYKEKFVAVEMDGRIVPKSEYESTVLREDVSLEVVSFVGGG